MSGRDVGSHSRLCHGGVRVGCSTVARALPTKMRSHVVSDAIIVDTYQVSDHGLGVALMDAFCHSVLDGQMYEG